MNIRNPVNEGPFFSFDAELVGVYVPLLVGLELLNNFGVTVELERDKKPRIW